MAERDSWATTGGIDQQDARMAIGALWTPGSSAIAAKTGFRPGPGSVTPGTVYASGTPDGNVHVQPFQATLQTSRATPGGPYVLTLDSVKDINILSTPANATNPRNDLVIAHQADTFYGDANSNMTVRQVVGTPSATPADPSTAAFPDCIILARVRVNASATTITSGNITDLRPSAPYTVAVGGILPVPTQAARDSLTGVYDGMPAYRQDRDWVEVRDSGAWRVQSLPVVTSIADLSAVSNPHTGLVASDTGNAVLHRYTGSAWQSITPHRQVVTLTGTAASIVFSSIPATTKTITLRVTGRGDAAGATVVQLYMRINGDSGGNYYGIRHAIANTTESIQNYSVSTVAAVGWISGPVAASNHFGQSTIELTGWSQASHMLNFTAHSAVYPSAATSMHETGGGVYNVAGPYASITLIANLGNFVVGTEATLEAWL